MNRGSAESQEGEADPRTGEGVIKAGDFTVDEKRRIRCI